MEIINSFFWSIATILLVAIGIYYAIKLDFLHLNFKEIIKSFMNDSKKENGISDFAQILEKVKQRKQKK